MKKLIGNKGSKETKPNKSIFVIEGGWVFLADDYEEDTGIIPGVKLLSASVIRVWGTTAGLGQIALKGPTKETILDACGNPTVPISKILARIPCTY